MKRTAVIFMRVSEEEKAKLIALAMKEGLTLSAWIRRFAYTCDNEQQQAKAIE